MQIRSYQSKLKSHAVKIAWITFFWVVISVFQILSNYALMIRLNCDLGEWDLGHFLLTSVISGLSAGLLGGSTVVFFWEDWLRTMSYGRSLLNILWSYSLVFILVSIITGLSFHAGHLNLPIYHPETLRMTGDQMTSLVQLQSYLFWLFVVIITLIALLVNDKYGPGVFASFILGKYFHPQREERIFMFLDLRGSTTIAEHLGERLYFNFLKDLFKDATPGILDSKGEIYQYVGDEVVVSWKKEPGTVHSNCLKCFFSIQKRLLKRKSYYQKAYKGVVPEFKAGLHCGYVMVGELGIIKREIAYSGDVLNTTARIQSKCNELGVNILLSKYLLEKLRSLPKSLIPKAVGEMTLRGKHQAVMLYTVA